MTDSQSGSLTSDAIAHPTLSLDTRWWVRYWPGLTTSAVHYWITLALLILLLPLATSTRLVFEPPFYLLALFTKVACSGIILAAILHLIDTPLQVTIESFRTHPVRLLMPVVMASAFITFIGLSAGLFLASVAFIVVEFFYRHQDQRLSIVGSMLAPALYLALGITLIWYYNDIAVSIRFPGTYDPVFMRLDSWFGVNVPALSKAAVARFSPRILIWAEQIYFRMFDILAATLILIVLLKGMSRAMQFVGAVVLAYYLTLVLFLLFPSQGPYYLCLDHAATFPKELISYPIQLSLLAEAKRLWQHTSILQVAGGYFISFPCMHVVKPTVALWHLRSHRRIALFLLAYLLVLPIAIVVLEMHYFVDIPIGFAIAALAILVTDPDARLRLKSQLRTFRAALHAEA